MANNLQGFILNNESPEQNYTVQDIDGLEQKRLLSTAVTGGVELVAIYEAEGSCIGIMPKRIAELLVKHLNTLKFDAFEALEYKDGVIPQNVVEGRSEGYGPHWQLTYQKPYNPLTDTL